MSASEALQTLLFETLTGDASVSTLVDGVFDNVPSKPFGPRSTYVSFGASDGRDDGADCIYLTEHTFQIDIWSRTVGKVYCRRVVDAVRRALHERRLKLSGYALVGLRVELWRVLADPDGLTSHGVVQVTARIEEPIP